jgi:hypothetical protein
MPAQRTRRHFVATDVPSCPGGRPAVMPAQAGIQWARAKINWIPASAGVTLLEIGGGTAWWRQAMKVRQ